MQQAGLRPGRSRDAVEPVASADHLLTSAGGGSSDRRFPRGLHALQCAQPALHQVHHGNGVRSAAKDGLRPLARLGGEAKALRGVGLGTDDLGGEQGFEGIGGAQRGDGVDRSLFADGTILRRAGRRVWEEAEEGVQGATPSPPSPAARRCAGEGVWLSTRLPCRTPRTPH
jgi:hypothetical protein